ncbi:MAG: hypothetical protein JWM12_870 [Ilumatobacteraceae bacterium]|nr:hypothetical protein [Ilumatobacteraceae bacterium]
MSDAGSAAPVRIVPRVRTRQQLADAPAKLVATLLSVATAGLLDAGRFRRGREYASSGSVTELVVGSRTLRGTVQGSRREPYEVEVHTSLVRSPAGGVASVQALMSITPDADDLHVVCTCPDADDSVCKHAAAVLLAFGEEASDRPELLLTWRCGDVAAPERATIGSRRWGAPPERSVAGGSVNRGPSGGRGPAGRGAGGPPSPFATPAWLEFVDFPAPLPAITDVPVGALGPGGEADADAEGDGSGVAAPARPAPARSAPVSLGSERLGSFDLSAMVRSAQQAMRAASSDVI